MGASPVFLHREERLYPVGCPCRGDQVRDWGVWDGASAWFWTADPDRMGVVRDRRHGSDLRARLVWDIPEGRVEASWSLGQAKAWQVQDLLDPGRCVILCLCSVSGWKRSSGPRCCNLCRSRLPRRSRFSPKVRQVGMDNEIDQVS
jgi:hypothetical protein